MRPFLLSVLVVTALFTPLVLENNSIALAHEVEASGNVGGIIHIEPNDAPQANKTHPTWIELRQKGGSAVPSGTYTFSAIVYDSQNQVAASPALVSDSSQGKSLLKTSLVFPAAGSYRLLIKGSPLSGTSAPAFELSFPITVAR